MSTLPPHFDYTTAPAKARRNPIGWLCLAIMLGALFGSQLVAYLKREAPTDVPYTQYEEQLRTAVRFRALESLLGKSRLRPLSGEAFTQPLQTLARVLPTDARAEKIYAAMRTEGGLPVRDTDLALLRKSALASDRAFATVYGSAPVTTAQITQLGKDLDSRLFINRLALAHAKERAQVPNPRAGLIPQKKIDQMLTGLALGGMALFLGAVALIFLASISLSATLPGHPAGKLTPSEADAFAVRAAQAMGLWTVVSLAVGLVGGKGSTFTASSLFLEGSLVIAAIYWLYRQPIRGISSEPALRLVGARKPSLRLVGWGLLGALANVPIVLTMAWLGMTIFRGLPTPEHPLTTEILGNPNLITLLAMIFVASVQAPFFEELLFRGTLFPALAGVMKSPLWAGVASSLLFAIIHPTGIPAWPALAAIGGMSAFLTYRTQSLVPSMVMHCVHNFATLVLAVLLS